MVQIAGKYQLERNENFIEFIKSLGQEIKPEHVEKLNQTNTIFEVTINGENVSFISHSSSGGAPRTTSFVLGKEFVEETLAGFKLNTTARKEGNTITLTAGLGAKSGDRIYEFSDKGLVVTFTSGDAIGKRIYKRL